MEYSASLSLFSDFIENSTYYPQDLVLSHVFLPGNVFLQSEINLVPKTKQRNELKKEN